MSLKRPNNKFSGPPTKHISYSKKDDDEDEENDVDAWFDNNNDDDNFEFQNNVEIVPITEEFSSWSRSKLCDINPQDTPLIFQQIDIDHYITSKEDPKPTFRFYGINKSGNSILSHVHGFYPYFYVEPPKNFKQTDCDEFRNALNTVLKQKATQHQGVKILVIKVEYCLKADIYGYCQDVKVPFLKVTIPLPALVGTCKRVLEEGININGYGYLNLASYDTDIDFPIRFMVDSGLVGCSWVEFPINTYTIRSDEQKTSLCQLEVDVNWDDIIYHTPGELWFEIAPIRILSFDIECAGRKGCFPEPEFDPVIQISNMIVRFGETEPFIKNIFTLNTCAPIVGSHVICHNTEDELLTHWAQFIREVDPDIITGYNIQNFDMPYLINRAHKLNVKGFNLLGRIKNVPSRIVESNIQSKQMGRRTNKMVHMTGRVQFDLLLILFRDYKLRSYSLNAVSFHFLEEQKEDVAHQIITDLQNGNDLTRRRLAVYCLKDSYLVLRLLQKLMCIVNYIEMARVTGVPLSYLLSRGQQIKVLSQLLRKAATQNFVLPNYQSKDGDEYTGATVIEPVKGFYTKPIATLDFASLYPSIMMAHNLCYTTLLPNINAIQQFNLKPEDYIKTPCGAYFVKGNIKRGMLPDILVQLLDARKKAKRDYSVETDPFKKQVLDGRQLALKMSANSVYGFTGAQRGRLPCLSISSSVTAFGRQMIDLTKDLVEKTFTKANGYENDAKVIYGDTDSVMCQFGVKTVEEAMILGKEASIRITQEFISPIKLEFEKVYYPYLLISKKRYAGMYYTKSEKFDKMDCKGMETVRRDNCPLVANLLTTCLQKLLISRDKNAAMEYAQSVIADLLCNRVDISQLIISKELTKTDEEYTNKQPHSELALKMRKRDPGSAPKLGDRVPYVITNIGLKDKIFTRAEDPIYVLDNNIPIDTEYYLKNQLINPLMRIFEPIFGKDVATRKLLHGEHMLTKTKPKSSVGDLSKFVVVRQKCKGCNNILKDNEKSLCTYCAPNASKIYQKEISNLVSLERKFSRLWTECQRCSGSLHQEVLCTSRDCPIFYMRKKVQKDLITQDDLVQKLEKDLDW